MHRVTATVQNAQGIHCRPSTVIVKEALAYDGKVTVAGEAGSCDLRSVLGLMTLGLKQGSPVEISVTGPDEAAVAEKLAALFERNFDFPPRAEGEAGASVSEPRPVLGRESPPPA